MVAILKRREFTLNNCIAYMNVNVQHFSLVHEMSLTISRKIIKIGRHFETVQAPTDLTLIF